MQFLKGFVKRTLNNKSEVNMDNNGKYFIYLISCFLNSIVPTDASEDWDEVYKLADINNVTGVIASEIKRMPNDLRPEGNIKSYFNQNLGKTIQRYEVNKKAQDKIKSFMCENGIDFLFVKGASVRKFYPVPELRTSGDIDVIVRKEKFNSVLDVLKNSDFEIMQANPNVIVLNVFDIEVEIHGDADVLSNYYNGRLFDISRKNGNEYILDSYDNLMYVILHLAKHLKARGAGIRMLMDMDVCIRAIDNFDEQRLIDMCSKAGIEKCSKMLLSLLNLWFDTPVSQFYNLEDDLVDLLANSFLYGGVFGFKNNDLGSHYVAQSATSNNVGIKDKIRAFFRWLFPPVSSVKNMYFYSAKYKILTPLAYLQRFLEGVFLRGKHSINTAKQIAKSDNSATIESQILSELDIS